LLAQTIIHAFSIDLEDWYQGVELPTRAWRNKEYRLEKGLDIILELLSDSQTLGTFFTLGWIAENYPKVVQKISALGHEIASHGYCHDKVYHLSPGEFRKDLILTKKVLEDAGGSEVRGHRSAFFSITQKSLWGLEVIKEAGFAYDCSISPIETWRYGISSSPDGLYKIDELGLIEFPISYFSFLGKRFGTGGAYFRIFPYYLIRRAFQQMSGRHQPGMFYAHPWEFDPDHPVISFDRKAQLTHYFNLKGMRKKTDRLLSDFGFSTVYQVIQDLLKSGSVPEISMDRLKTAGRAEKNESAGGERSLPGGGSQ